MREQSGALFEQNKLFHALSRKNLGGLRGGDFVQTAHEQEKLEYRFEIVDSCPANLTDKQISVVATMIERWLVLNREVIVSGTQRIA